MDYKTSEATFFGKDRLYIYTGITLRYEEWEQSSNEKCYKMRRNNYFYKLIARAVSMVSYVKMWM